MLSSARWLRSLRNAIAATRHTPSSTRSTSRCTRGRTESHFAHGGGPNRGMMRPRRSIEARGRHRVSPGFRSQLSLWSVRVFRARGRAAQEWHSATPQEQPFCVLLELVANAGKVVSCEGSWPADTFVDFDTGLHTAIRRLRPALND